MIVGANQGKFLPLISTRKNKYGCQVCNKGHMTSIFEPDMAIMKVNMYIERNTLYEGIQKILYQEAHIQTDSCL